MLGYIELNFKATKIQKEKLDRYSINVMGRKKQKDYARKLNREILANTTGRFLFCSNDIFAAMSTIFAIKLFYDLSRLCEMHTYLYENF